MRNDLGRMYGVGIMAFILFLSTMVGVPVLPKLAKELGAGAAGIPIVVAAALATVVIFQFFTGILADRYSKRTLILIGALVGSGSSLLCVIATHWVQLTVLRVIGGIADAIAWPALLSITASLGGRRPGKFFGILRSGQGLSFVVGPALGSVFSLISLRMPFVVDGILSLFAFVAAITLLKQVDKAKSQHNLSILRGLRSVFASKRVYVYLLMGISGLFGFGILHSFVATEAQLLNLEAWQIGVILSGGSLAFTIVSYAVGILSDRFGRRKFAIAAQAIIVVAGIGLAFSKSFSTLLMFYGLFCIGEATTYLLCFVYATDVFDKKYIGFSMGAFDSIMDLSLFVGPAVAILVYDSVGRTSPVFLIAVIPAALAFFTTAILLPKETRAADRHSTEC